MVLKELTALELARIAAGPPRHNPSDLVGSRKERSQYDWLVRRQKKLAALTDAPPPPSKDEPPSKLPRHESLLPLADPMLPPIPPLLPSVPQPDLSARAMVGGLKTAFRKNELPQEMLAVAMQHTITHVHGLAAYLRHGCPEMAGFDVQTDRRPRGGGDSTGDMLTCQGKLCNGRQHAVDALKRRLRARLSKVPNCAYAITLLEKLNAGERPTDYLCVSCMLDPVLMAAAQTRVLQLHLRADELGWTTVKNGTLITLNATFRSCPLLMNVGKNCLESVRTNPAHNSCVKYSITT